MKHTQFPSIAEVPASAVAELRACGVSDDEICWAWLTQEAQRRSPTAPVLPLRVLCGLEPRSSANGQVSDALGPIASELAGTKPRVKTKKGGRHVTGAKVHAESVQTGSAAEDDFVQPLSAGAHKTMRQACYRAFDRAKDLAVARRAGQDLTPDELRLSLFTKSCRDMMLGILDHLHHFKGWCFPAYETLMEWAGTGRRMVKYALDRLHAIGLVEWIRRFDYTYDKRDGARSEQTSNLYRAHLPEWLAQMLGLDAPVPDDEQQRREEALEEHAIMLASVGKVERRQIMPSEPAARAALIAAAARLWTRRRVASASARECNPCTEPHLKSFDKRERSCPGRATRQP